MKKLIALRAALLFLAILFILIGCVRGEVKIVLTKAVTICLECVGIG